METSLSLGIPSFWQVLFLWPCAYTSVTETRHLTALSYGGLELCETVSDCWGFINDAIVF